MSIGIIVVLPPSPPSPVGHKAVHVNMAMLDEHPDNSNNHNKKSDALKSSVDYDEESVINEAVYTTFDEVNSIHLSSNIEHYNIIYYTEFEFNSKYTNGSIHLRDILLMNYFLINKHIFELSTRYTEVTLNSPPLRRRPFTVGRYVHVSVEVVVAGAGFHQNSERRSRSHLRNYGARDWRVAARFGCLATRRASLPHRKNDGGAN